MSAAAYWKRYRNCLCDCPDVGISLDVSRVSFDDGFLARMAGPMEKAFAAMQDLEGGAIANKDEGWMVGHYWLRAAALAPQGEPAIQEAITTTVKKVEAFARDVHSGEIAPPGGGRFTDVLVVGIGGSALGPQFLADALGTPYDRLAMHFSDNTDPDGFCRVLARLDQRLGSTLVIVISKSGDTKETRNGMLEFEHAFHAAGLDFPRHAVAITREHDSRLHEIANGWLARFPTWDWVGGRTSITSAVGLLPGALQGVDTGRFLAGAAAMDEITRGRTIRKNPAALLALMWHFLTDGKGRKDMVILPYKDRLLLLPRYLQQLVMESLGKGLDLDDRPVEQGITVYGNKGSTDQHAYVQQLRDGVHNFFVNFVLVLQDQCPSLGRPAFQVEPNRTSGDYLNSFWQGTRKALAEKGRQSITLTLDRLDAHRLGALIALYERAVGFYGSLVNINAYHQPGVKAGKHAADCVLEIQDILLAYLQARPEQLVGVEALAKALAEQSRSQEDPETVYHILEHLCANARGVVREGTEYAWKP